jgi:hypothetical protein
MKRLALGSLLVLVLVMAAVAVGQQRAEMSAPRAAPAPAAASGTELIVVPTALGEKGQMLTIVDPRQRVMSVYHIELATGKIALKSVRNISGDLQMLYMNNEPPLPQEIRSGLEQLK